MLSDILTYLVIHPEARNKIRVLQKQKSNHPYVNILSICYLESTITIELTKQNYPFAVEEPQNIFYCTPLRHDPEERIFMTHYINEITRRINAPVHVTQKEMRELFDSEANIRALNARLVEYEVGAIVRNDITYP